MKCIHCGYESELNFRYCPGCGQASPDMPAVRNPAADAILPALKDTLFLVLCILLTASCVASLLNGAVPLLNILLTIFLWLTYAQSRKDIAASKHLRQISGTVYASYVISYVLAGLLILLGILFAVAFGSFAAMPGVLDEVTAELGQSLPGPVAGLSGAIASFSGVIILVVFLLLGVGLAVVNAFSLRYLHAFAQSVYQSIERGTLALKRTNAAQSWLIVFAVLYGISVLSGLFDGDFLMILSNACLCAASILAATVIRKYFLHPAASDPS